MVISIIRSAIVAGPDSRPYAALHCSYVIIAAGDFKWISHRSISGCVALGLDAGNVGTLYCIAKQGA
jgi:hypothetical protein